MRSGVAMADRDDIFLFAGFRLDRRGGSLFRCGEDGALIPVPIGPRALDVLGVLVARAGDLVSRDEIIAAAWPETVVNDNNLNMQIAAIRRVLDDGEAHAQLHPDNSPARLSFRRAGDPGRAPGTTDTCPTVASWRSGLCGSPRARNRDRATGPAAPSWRGSSAR